VYTAELCAFPDPTDAMEAYLYSEGDSGLNLRCQQRMTAMFSTLAWYTSTRSVLRLEKCQTYGQRMELTICFTHPAFLLSQIPTRSGGAGPVDAPT
jgi:hypothetical protein